MQKILKILYINATSELGGTDTDLLATVRALDKTKFAPTVMLPHPGPLDAQYQVLGVPLLYRKLGIVKRSDSRLRQLLTFLSLPLILFQMWRLIKHEKFNLVFSNSILILCPGLAARLAGKKAVWHSGEIYARPAFLKFGIYNLIGLLADRVIVSSDAVREFFPKWARGRVITVHNGIELDRFNPRLEKMQEAAYNIRCEFDIPTEAPLVGFVGRFTPWKGVKEYLLACVQAAQNPTLTGVHFLAVGSRLPGYEEYFQELQTLAKQSNISERFHFATNRQDIPAFLAAFDLFVHASTRPEPFGIVITEALAMGKPVIATRGGGVLEILETSNVGKLVEIGNIPALARAIEELMTDQSERERLSLAGREMALTRFDIHKVTVRHQEIYQELFATSTPYSLVPALKAPDLTDVQKPVVSIVIVNYNGRDKIIGGLNALEAGLEGIKAEIFIVDNASTDASLTSIYSWLRTLPPPNRARYKLIENRQNLGYSKANNQAIRESRGEFILLLNPDAEVAPDAIPLALNFMREKGQVGILGPRILLPNGELDAPCRRSFKTPSIYLYKFLGLSKLFPKSHRFGKYYLSYLDENLTTEVDAVIGAFLLIRLEVIEQIGLLDERYFIYCEDEDWCFQAKKRSWQVYYYPAAIVHHVKGASTSQRKLRMIWEWHKSVFKFHRKNLASNYLWLVNFLIYSGIAAQLILSLALNLARRIFKHR